MIVDRQTVWRLASVSSRTTQKSLISFDNARIPLGIDAHLEVFIIVCSRLPQVAASVESVVQSVKTGKELIVARNCRETDNSRALRGTSRSAIEGSSMPSTCSVRREQGSTER